MNTNNKKNFVPYKQALALKELGFDEPCLGLYHNDKTFYPTQCKSHEQFHGQVCSAPLYQQAFRWFREKYNLREQYGVFPHHTIMINYLIEGGREEEAELECLNKLIEIVKQQL
jgi:hypothetical protein